MTPTTTTHTEQQHMTAHEVIEAIRASVEGIDLRGIRHALEDGAALAALGIGDGDTEAVEEAHAIILGRINAT